MIQMHIAMKIPTSASPVIKPAANSMPFCLSFS